MSKVNLKDNIWIEGFASEEAYRSKLYGSKGIKNQIKLIYQGKTSKISEELLKDILDERSNFINDKKCTCGERTICYYCENIFYSKNEEFIKEICPEEYCIIYKTN